MIVKVTSYIRPGRGGRAKAKATLRYISHRPNMAGERVSRTLFGLDGPMEKYHGYEMIDGAPKGSFFYRTAFSPDPAREDLYQDLDLWGMTQAAVAFLKERLGTDIQFFAAAHDDQTDIRHVNAVIIVPGRLSKQDFRRLPKLLREAALANVLQQRQLLTPEETQEMAPPAPATGPVASQERQERLYRSVAAVDDPFRVSPPPQPTCPDCGPDAPLWQMDAASYFCPDCGLHFTPVSPFGGLTQKGSELRL